MSARKLAKYWAIFTIQLQSAAAYPLDLAARSLSIVMFMVVFFGLWRSTYAAQGATSIAGLTLRDTLWYLMLAETVVLSRPRLAQQIAAQVKDGSIAYLLNKPYSFLLYQAAAGLGDSALRLVFNAAAGGAVVWLLVGPPPALWGLPLVLVAVAMGWLIDFCVAALLGLTAFFSEEVAAFEWIYSKVLFLLGGLLIPLDFFPEWLQGVARALPFAAAIYGPARLFVSPSLGAFAWLLAAQVGWLGGLGLVVALAYRRGSAALAINGG
ncbi:MAG TPA: ABC-2 family transporter protein [Chloroflexaceae bacterium]|nr:ABC-2 family transporter protein [Chloroflexaceae bacterium]